MTEQSTAGVREVETWLRSLADIAGPRGDEALALARSLVEALGNPQRAAPAVHVVGTAGKGTAASMLTGSIVAGGCSVATHMSPHVHDIRERFTIDGDFPSAEALADAFAEVRAAAAIVAREHGRPPTFFAASAAISWVLGRDAAVDVFVTEAGIGGRLDATAVLDRPDTITAITAIGVDHTEVLGADVEAIAGEKAAVLAGRRVAVLGPQPDPAAAAVVHARADEARVGLVEVAATGSWQSDGRAVAAACAVALGDLLGVTLPPPVDVLPVGRSERRDLAGRRLVLDGAHNPLKLAALVASLSVDAPPAIVVAALGAGKDLDGCAAALARLDCPVVATEFGGAVPPRSHRAGDVADALRRHGVDAAAESTVANAVARAVDRTASGETILVTGSFLILADAVAAVTA